MFLTLTARRSDALDPATDLGFLLHKNPGRAQRVDLPVGTAHVFYPEATDEVCTVALLLEVDPIGLVRNRRFGGEAFSLAQYVNDRPYAASSLLSVALGKVFSTARAGRCDARPDLPDARLPLTVHAPAVPCDEGPDLVRRLFEPLGWRVETHVAPLDETVPAWGAAPYVDVTLTGTLTVAEALGHLYVLLPVLDGAKHYWVSGDEVDKLVRSGGDWLARHPERDLITRRALAHQRSYVADATARLTGEVPAPRAEAIDPARRPLRARRREAVVAALHDAGAHRVVDVGCGEGALLADLLADPAFTEVVGVDVSARALTRAADRLGLDRMGDRQRERLALRQSSVTYRDTSLAGYDALVLMEVIEHVDLDRLPSLERSVFAHASPATVVVTTPNADHNAAYAGLAPGAFRHPDHRFEWGRNDFATWCENVGATYGYAVERRDVGEPDSRLGPPTQLALFTRKDAR